MSVGMRVLQQRRPCHTVTSSYVVRAGIMSSAADVSTSVGDDGSAPTSNTAANDPTRIIVDVPRENEFRLQCDVDQSATVQLLEGTAEVFGTELARGKVYTFTSTSVGLFTWHGCKIQVTGKCHSYTSDETPMVPYVNVHAVLHARRTRAAAENKDGPRVMVCGPPDAGTSTLARMLLSYATRQAFTPTLVDLDVGQSSLTVPGALSAITVYRPMDVERLHAEIGAAMSLFYGFLTPEENPKLYALLAGKLVASVYRRFAVHAALNHAGVIVATAGWVDVAGRGYQPLLELAKTCAVDVVLVVGHERLFNDLQRELRTMMPGTAVVKMAKSGGVVSRDAKARRRAVITRIREYFYGPGNDLCPHSTVVDFRDVVLLQPGGGPQAPSTALPIGAERKTDITTPHEIAPSPGLIHSIVAVSYATSAETANDASVAGFVYVSNVDMERRKLTLLAPCAGQLPSKYLIVGTGIKWID